MLLVMRVRGRGYDRRLVGKVPGGDRLGSDGISRPRCLFRLGRFSTPGLLCGLRIALCLVSPNIGFLEHAGAATRIFDAPIIGIEAANNRCLTPGLALAHHDTGAGWAKVNTSTPATPARA